MTNVFDYITWRGDLTFAQDELHAVDSLLFCCISYLRYQALLPDEDSCLSIKELAAQAKQLEEDKLYGRVEDDKRLLYAMAEAPRFQDVRLTHYIDHIDPSSEKQFSALTCILDDTHLLIAFRGTDNTFVGWKEDFNMTFLETIPSQLEALAYVKTIAKRYPKHRIYTAGHSKGGNLAVFASAFIDKAIQPRLLHIYNHDGPGFDANILKQEGYQAICERIQTYVPQSSVVGMLMEHEEHYTVISSTQISLWQHDPYSWEICGNDFIRLSRVDTSSIVLDTTIKHWIADLSKEQREAFIDAIFAILSTTNAESFKELNENRMKNVAIMLKAFNETDKETRKMVSDILKKLFGSMKETIDGTLKETSEAWLHTHEEDSSDKH